MAFRAVATTSILHLASANGTGANHTNKSALVLGEYSCYNYGFHDGVMENDEWCKTIGKKDDYFYKLSAESCGDCMCCRAQVLEARPNAAATEAKMNEAYMAQLVAKGQVMAKEAENAAIQKLQQDDQKLECGAVSCRWTTDWNCPGQAKGSQGAAAEDGTPGYTCCCLQERWKVMMMPNTTTMRTKGTTKTTTKKDQDGKKDAAKSTTKTTTKKDHDGKKDAAKGTTKTTKQNQTGKKDAANGANKTTTKKNQTGRKDAAKATTNTTKKEEDDYYDDAEKSTVKASKLYSTNDGIGKKSAGPQHLMLISCACISAAMVSIAAGMRVWRWRSLATTQARLLGSEEEIGEQAIVDECGDDQPIVNQFE